MAAEESSITFDDKHALRIFNPDKFNASVQLHEKSEEFVSKLKEFDSMVKGVMTVIKAQGDLIEQEKLRAIGMRNLVKAEEENRKAQVNEYHRIIADKHAELDRYNAELESLKKVEIEQRKMIERLSNNEPESSIDE